MPQKSFSGRKKQVRAAEKARLIRTLVNNDPMNLPTLWDTVSSLGIIVPIGWKMTQGRCTILMQKDVFLVHELGVLKVPPPEHENASLHSQKHPLKMKGKLNETPFLTEIQQIYGGFDVHLFIYLFIYTFNDIHT